MQSSQHLTEMTRMYLFITKMWTKKLGWGRERDEGEGEKEGEREDILDS